MSSHYNTEPPPTASATLQTTVGPIHISLFAKQTPLACKNFLQHCLDGYYTNTTFHRVVPNFVVQAGDPTGTGSGGSSIYEDAEFERDPRDPSQKIVFGDEIHSRLKFNRRGLVGMAKGEDGRYGSQFFITLAPAERELTGTCTLFGRLEGESIYNIVKIAEAELVEGTERPVYSVKITGCEVDDLGPFDGQLRKREKIAIAEKEPEVRKESSKKKKKQVKTLLSFGAGEEEDEESLPISKPKKPKFNTSLVMDMLPADEKRRGSLPERSSQSATQTSGSVEQHSNSRLSGKQFRSPLRSHSPQTSRRLSRDPNTQLPLPDPESPRSPSPSPDQSPQRSRASKLNAEIESLKASMRRTTGPASSEPTRIKSALESLIPKNSIRGRKRPAPGSANGADTNGRSEEADTLKRLNAFKAKLEKADEEATKKKPQISKSSTTTTTTTITNDEPTRQPQTSRRELGDAEDEEAQICDLHFIANCQSCRAWDLRDSGTGLGADHEDDNAMDWMTHELKFAKDRLGKDQTWKESNRDVDDLVVIDPRQKEKEIRGGRKQESGRDRERARELERERKMEWARKQGHSR
ncbi:peptidyl-prolyl cis-trans isomerase, cyclophilin-type domain containing protein [Coccidioides posadasii C735 delta SOWgp]|uniref:Peptidyl-prolyl cis-trans isomerase, cyclophilin-type domain containing protein n=1 Tax=Coccidioides posadasii (strain C735) TaxID=222929 RepID=C5P814_COCP7|nr:peptidyl-prolyl cis-trans isomerase, cyclophilin-type domain containing protein [Coccidioides posadasii C735 delta SOWgp]EER27564.1 peptidyl-prolyl cis-trans isomerase, cyclophilin-type domain containing protein [Coccidioides posadasii C735 delta SOWgp]|eukprot:XP_003069709.1 peptidyl-prolyl cis-trans isomerase, cyclophilin-type domain containing protein [Coccidioides posadasii C735 delta SOWgp]